MARGVREGAGARIVNYGGTSLDHTIRAAIHDVNTLEHSLAAAEGSYARATAIIEKARDTFTPAIAEAKQRVKELLQAKEKESPKFEAIPGVKKQKIPKGMTVQQWHELRKAGTHLEHLRKVY